MSHPPHAAVRVEPWGTHTRRQRPAPPSLPPHWTDQLGSLLLRPRPIRLPALSAFNCSSTSRPNCEKLNWATATYPSTRPTHTLPANPTHTPLFIPPTKCTQEETKRYLSSDVFVWFRPALVSGRRLLCSANISSSACSSSFCCVKTRWCVFQRTSKPELRASLTYCGAEEQCCSL